MLIISIFDILLLFQGSPQLKTTENVQNIKTLNCTFQYDYMNRYSCSILSSITINPTDVMEITGIHLENHTNSNVQRFSMALLKIPQFNGEVMKIFENLESFEFSSTETLKIHENAFEFCGHLKELEIRSNPLTTLPESMLKNCENLKSFTLGNCKVTHLPSDLFGATAKLETFNVYGSNMLVLPPGLLLNMRNLRTFSAYRNGLTQIDSTVFKDAENLETFSISENFIENIDPVIDMLNKSLNLKYLNMEENRFKFVDFSALSKFTKLEFLSIGNRFGLEIINWGSLPIQINDLAVYGINDNIPENGLQSYTNLSRLTLNGPGITDIKKDTFKGQINLKFLHLQPTNLTTLYPEIFTHQSNLTALIFENSQVEELPEGIFVPLNKLGSGDYSNPLRIRFNKIKKLNLNSFGHHKSIENLDLSSNKIDAIERGFFSRFNLNMTHLDFSGNICASSNLYNIYDLDNDEIFKKCFDNWDNWNEMSATTPGSGQKYVLSGILVIFVAALYIF